MDKQYKELLETLLVKGYWYDDPNRVGTKRLQINDYKITHNFEEGFPVLTTKKTYYKGAFGELLSFLRGETNLKNLHNNGVKFWDKDGYNYYRKLCKDNNWIPLSFEDYIKAVEENGLYGNNIVLKLGLGKLGKIYPYQMRKWNGQIDQIKNLIKTLQENPVATKKTVTMWNPSDLKDSALSPCHWSFECLVTPLSESYEGVLFDLGSNEPKQTIWKSPKYGLIIKWHQHSVDCFLGLPLNIIYYSLLCYILCELCNLKPLGIIGDLSNVHLYDNAVEGAKEQLKREEYKLPTFKFSEKAKILFKKYKGSEPKDYGYYDNLDNVLSALTVDDFIIENYESHPTIKVEMLPYKK